MSGRTTTGDRRGIRLELSCKILGTGLLLSSVISTPALAESRALPVWEVGMGVFPSTFPAYRGSRDQQAYLLPFPYLVYRGDILKIDREGIRAQLFDSDRVELNISLNGSVPVSSDDSVARRGMPDLDPTFEVGPSLNILLAQFAPHQRLSLRLPVRAVIATDFRQSEQAGWLAHPHLNLDTRNFAGGWNIGWSLGPLFATRDYHAYYYEVQPQYVTPARNAYRAGAGYSGAATILSVSRRFDDFWVGGFIRYDYLGHADFEDSPLVETEHATMAGIAIAWVFAKSTDSISIYR